MRLYKEGATRNDATGKFNYEGFFSPLFVHAYGEYMHEHRRQADGTLRPADNWQKGIPLQDYMDSGWRHFFDWWAIHDGYAVYKETTIDADKQTIETTHILIKALTKLPKTWRRVTLQEATSGLFFNLQGYTDRALKGYEK